MLLMFAVKMEQAILQSGKHVAARTLKTKPHVCYAVGSTSTRCERHVARRLIAERAVAVRVLE